MKVFVLLLMCWCKLVVVETIDDHPHYNANGIVCNKCPPGTFVQKDCTKNYANPICKACPDHHYMDEWNDKDHCKPCKSSCPGNGREVQTCNQTANRVCRCDDGFHRFPVDHIDPHWTCKAHQSCERGSGEKDYGNHTHDTTCEKCEEGQQFVNMTDEKHPKCQACSECVNGTDLLSNCTLTSDTVCSDVRTTAQPQSPKDSEGLGGGPIAGIVIGLLLSIMIVICVCLARRHCKHENNSTRSWSTFLCVELRRLIRGRASTHKKDNGRIRNFSSGRNGTENGETSNSLLPLNETGHGETNNQLLSPNENWPEQFIERHVCPFLSKNVGSEWQRFILQLPGWPADQSVNTIIDHKKEEQREVPNMILECLKEWMRKARPQPVNRDGIVTALTSVERTDLVERLDQLASDQLSPAQPNGQP